MSALPMHAVRPTSQAAPRLRVRPVPVTDPPPVIEPWARQAHDDRNLTLAWPTPDGSARARGRHGDRQPIDEVEPPAPRLDGDLPDPERAAATLAVAVMEVLNGVRPASQLVRWTNHDVHAALARRAAVTARMTQQQPRARRPPVVRGVRVCRPSINVAETSAVVVTPDRVRAMAIRLEATEGRWRATALEIG